MIFLDKKQNAQSLLFRENAYNWCSHQFNLLQTSAIWYIFCYIRKAKNTITMAEPRLPYIRPLIEQESFIIEGGFALSDPSSSLTETIPEEDTGFSSDDFWQ